MENLSYEVLRDTALALVVPVMKIKKEVDTHIERHGIFDAITRFAIRDYQALYNLKESLHQEIIKRPEFIIQYPN